MNKNFIFYICCVLLLFSCRKDEEIVPNYKNPNPASKWHDKISFFVNYDYDSRYSKDDYSVPFKQSIHQYFTHNPEKKDFIEQRLGAIDLGVSSQTFSGKEGNNYKFIFFPIVKGEKVVTGVLSGFINSGRDTLYCDVYDATVPEVKEMMEEFQKFYSRSNQNPYRPGSFSESVAHRFYEGDIKVLNDKYTSIPSVTIIVPPKVGISYGSRPSWPVWTLPAWNGGGHFIGGGGRWSNGSGGGFNTPPNQTPPTNNDPCSKMKEKQKRYSEYWKNFEYLNREEIFNLNHEMGYYETANVGFTKLQGGEGTTSLSLPDNTSGVYGILHTHNNREGVVKIFSPADVKAFINIQLSNAKAYVGSYTDAYSTVVTSEGSYTLKFSKEIHPGGISFGIEQEWDEWYREEMQDIRDYEGYFSQSDVERVFMRFITEVVRIDGLEVYKTTQNSSAKMNYDKTKDIVKLDNPC